MTYDQFAAIQPHGYPVHMHGRVRPTADDFQDWPSSECSDLQYDSAAAESDMEPGSQEAEAFENNGERIGSPANAGPSLSDADSSAGPSQVRPQTEGELAEEGKSTKSGM